MQRSTPIIRLLQRPRRSRRVKPAPRAVLGFSLVEVMISVLIVMVLVAGVMGYQYRSTHDVKLAEVQAAAARLSMMLLEGWKGVDGISGFDPVSTFTELQIESALSGPAVPNDAALTVLDYYEIQDEDVCYYVALAWAQADDQRPRLLHVTTAWRRDYTRGSLTGEEAAVRYSAFTVDY